MVPPRFSLFLTDFSIGLLFGHLELAGLMESFPSLLVVSQPKLGRYPSDLEAMDVVLVMGKADWRFLWHFAWLLEGLTPSSCGH